MADNEKERQSGESPRTQEPVLPSVNAVEKHEPPKASLHPAFYVVYVAPVYERVKY